MKKTQILTAAVCALILFGSVPHSAQAASVTMVAIDPEIAVLQMEVAKLKAKLAVLQGIESGVLDERQNLSIKATRLLKSTIDADDPLQRITIFAGNNRYGGEKLSELLFEYTVDLYEVIDKKRVNLDRTLTNYALIPSADLNSSFRVEIDSDDYREADDRTFIAKVRIDSPRIIKESNENDNVKWTDEWTVAGNE